MDADINKAALLADVMKWSGVDKQRAGDITIQDFMDESGLGRAAARTRLDVLVMAGRLTKHLVTLDSSKQGYVYRAADKTA